MDTRRWIRNIGQYFLLSVIVATPLSAKKIEPPTGYIDSQEDFDDFIEYMNSLEGDEALDQIASLIFQFRQSMVDCGLVCPSMTQLFNDSKETLEASGIELDKSDVDSLLRTFERLENQQVMVKKLNFGLKDEDFAKKKHHPHKSKHRHKRKKKEVTMSGKMAIGFCKFLAGALCAIIPHPITQAAGVALMTNGITDMTRDILDPQKEASGGLANPPAIYDPIVNFKVETAILRPQTL